MKRTSRPAVASHFQHLRRLTNWPLGESGVFARLDWLATLPDLHAGNAEAQFQEMIEDLAQMYVRIHSTFDEFRRPFDPMDSKRPQHPKAVRHAAKMHFSELATTTRFEVEDLTQTGEIIRVKLNPSQPLGLRHSIALSALVCFKNALESLEELTDSHGIEVGRLLADATESRDQAASWLAHLETWNVVCVETEQRIKSERAEQAVRAAKKLRTALTPKMVSIYFKDNQGRPQKALVQELRELYDVSIRTINTRLKEARSLGMMQ
ncbi:MAG: hypothetical protein KBF98_09895 [Rhodoferax sp.]|nr:hypothetical protein [Rhodoferax sp.]